MINFIMFFSRTFRWFKTIIYHFGISNKEDLNAIYVINDNIHLVKKPDFGFVEQKFDWMSVF